MHCIILRTSPTAARYLLWSRPLEDVEHVGDRDYVIGVLRRIGSTSTDDVSTSLMAPVDLPADRVRLHVEATAALRQESTDDRLARVDRLGTSAADPRPGVQFGGYDAPGLRVRGVLWLPRPRLDDYAQALMEQAGSAVLEAMLEPWTGQSQW